MIIQTIKDNRPYIVTSIQTIKDVRFSGESQIREVGVKLKDFPEQLLINTDLLKVVQKQPKRKLF